MIHRRLYPGLSKGRVSLGKVVISGQWRVTWLLYVSEAAGLAGCVCLPDDGLRPSAGRRKAHRRKARPRRLNRTSVNASARPPRLSETASFADGPLSSGTKRSASGMPGRPAPRREGISLAMPRLRATSGTGSRRSTMTSD